jgi:hypothetical protein
MKTIVTMKITNQVTAAGKILAKKFSVLSKPSKSFVNKTLGRTRKILRVLSTKLVVPM